MQPAMLQINNRAAVIENSSTPSEPVSQENVNAIFAEMM